MARVRWPTAAFVLVLMVVLLEWSFTEAKKGEDPALEKACGHLEDQKDQDKMDKCVEDFKKAKGGSWKVGVANGVVASGLLVLFF